VLVGLGAIPIQIDSIGGLHANRRRRLRDDGRDRRGDRARSANFLTTGVRYISTLEAMPVDASSRLASAFEAAPVGLPRGPPRHPSHDRSAIAAVDLTPVTPGAEIKHAAASRRRALNLSNRTHAVDDDGRKLDRAGEPCDSSRTSHAVATMGSEGEISGPYSFAVPAILSRTPGRRPTTRRPPIPAFSRARRQKQRPCGEISGGAAAAAVSASIQSSGGASSRTPKSGVTRARAGTRSRRSSGPASRRFVVCSRRHDGVRRERTK